MVEAAGIEPASASDPLQALHVYSVFNLTESYPTGRENSQPVQLSFSVQALDSPFRDLVRMTPGTGRTSTCRAEGFSLCFKQLERSCLRLQLYFLQLVLRGSLPLDMHLKIHDPRRSRSPPRSLSLVVLGDI